MPFRCRKCHKTGHLVAKCSFDSRPKKSPTWWKGVSDDHYTVQKAPSIGDSGSPQDTLVVDTMAVDGTIVAPTMVPPLDSVTGASTAAPLVALPLDVAIVPSSDVAQGSP